MQNPTGYKPDPEKVYNILVLDVERDSPTNETNEAKWWLVSDHGKYRIYKALSKKTGEQTYVATYNGKPYADHPNFEAITWRETMIRTGRRLRANG